jgi:hypothetical protein
MLNGTSYGWENDFIYISGYNFLDPAIYGNSTDDITVLFGTNRGIVTELIFDDDDFYDLGDLVTLNVTVPSGEWNTLVDLHVEWNIINFPTLPSVTPSPTISATTSNSATVSVTPNVVVGTITSTPSPTLAPSIDVTTASNNDIFEPSFEFGTCIGDNSLLAGKFHYGPVLDSISPDFGYVNGEDEVRISGFAYTCCGIQNVMECLFPPFTKPTSNYTLPLPFDDDDTTIFDDDDSIICTVPPNEKIDLLLRNIGLRFNSTLISNSVSLLHRTEDEKSLDYYYGPLITEVTPTVHSLSSIGESIEFTGIGFNDPFLSNPVCNFEMFEGETLISTWNVTATTNSDTSITCDLVEYIHECKTYDNVNIIWQRANNQLRPQLGFNYYKTNVPSTFKEKTSDVPAFSIDFGSLTPTWYGPLTYGPIITAIDVVSETTANTDLNSLRSYTNGGLDIIITFDNIADWIDNTDDDNNAFGSELGLCQFGDRYSNLLYSLENDNTLRCSVPAGAFNLQSPIRVILDPHINIDTTLYSFIDQPAWTWVPYADTISRPFGSENGHEALTITGEGFGNYHTVVCKFNGEQAVQSDILNDNALTCIAPPISAGVKQIDLDFCYDQNCPTSRHTTIHTGSYTIAGITSLNPVFGPRCGNTEVTITGFGFHLFDSVRCRFANKYITPATVIDENTITCVTPDASDASTENPVNCINVELLGQYRETGSIILTSPVTFEFGKPEIISADPVEAHIEERTEIVIRGEFFNGGNQFGVYNCLFGDFTPQPATIHSFYEDDEEEKFAIVCNTPTVKQYPDMVIGTVSLEIEFDCTTTSKTFNNLPFTFYQTPDIDSFFPESGPEFGGTEITVIGERFIGGYNYLCSFGTIGINNQLVSATYVDEHTLTCRSPAKIVDTNTPVDFGISIDGGQHIALSKTTFRFDNVNRECSHNSASTVYVNSFILFFISFFFIFF